MPTLIFISKYATSIPSSHKDKIIAIQEELFQKYKQENEELRQKIKEWKEWKAATKSVIQKEMTKQI